MISPNDLLSDARHLTGAGALSEARRRTILSRCYYAAYHHLRGHSCARSFDEYAPGNTGMHKRFITYLAKHTDSQVRLAGARLSSLYSLRLRADYRIGLTIIPGAVEDALADAEEILFEIFPA